MIGTTNAIARIQEQQSYTLTPVMTGYTSGDITIFASSYLNGNWLPWMAFKNTPNGADNNCWHALNNTFPQWIGFKHNSKKSKVTSITMYSRSGYGNNRMPKQWCLQGSDNEINWDIIQEYTSTGSPTNVTVQSYPKWYYNYRIYIRNSTSSDVVNISEIYFKGYYE